MQPPQEPQAGQPAFPGYGTPAPAGQSPYTAYSDPVAPYGYYPPAYGRSLPAPQTSSFAIASLVCSIASWFVIPFVGAVAAVILGHIARHEIRHSYGQKGGSGLAIAGLVIGYIQIGLAILGGIVLLWVIFVYATYSST